MRRCYGDSYDAAWVYDPAEVADRLRRGTLWSTVGIADDGELVAHVGLARQRPDDDVAESGRPWSTPSTAVGTCSPSCWSQAGHAAGPPGRALGLYSEATAAHPYSHAPTWRSARSRPGLLLGYIPATVEYEAIDAEAHRQSVVLYYLKTNDGHARPVYAPRRPAMVETILAARVCARRRARCG